MARQKTEAEMLSNQKLVKNMLVCWIIFMGVIIIITGEIFVRNIVSDYVTKDTITTDGYTLYGPVRSSNDMFNLISRYLEDTYPNETFEWYGITEQNHIQVSSDKYPEAVMSIKAIQYKHTDKWYFVDNRRELEEWYRTHTETDAALTIDERN